MLRMKLCFTSYGRTVCRLGEIRSRIAISEVMSRVSAVGTLCGVWDSCVRYSAMTVRRTS